jgi:hypothetical protein
MICIPILKCAGLRIRVTKGSAVVVSGALKFLSLSVIMSVASFEGFAIVKVTDNLGWGDVCFGQGGRILSVREGSRLESG